ncbi:SMI1/KNR4 family protein [Paenibacillus terrae]|uniref:SMI1/KNR4 family protein n=1 Tax=Paenibacillus terrae TaxID=159743 RepID=A0A4U2Q0Z8_9BACL|nr:SMI1/KNR4 family protein [Paenibacillus terrae]TKH45677.1 SMI1/KNR4 family protein [Paenibacillus terrae]
MTDHFGQILDRLGDIAERLRQSGMPDVEYKSTEGISTVEITALEERLQMTLPASLSELIQRCGSLYLLWSLPQHCIVADVSKRTGEYSFTSDHGLNILEDITGEFGWNHEYISYFTSYGENADSPATTDEHRYLIFNYNGAGDPVLLDLATSTTEPAVFCYDHEQDRLTLLADNLPAYIDTILTLHGLWVWDWTTVIDEHGIQLTSHPLQMWVRWLDVFCNVKLEDAHSLEALINYTTMHGVDNPAILQTFQAYDPKDIFLAWEQRLQHSPVNFAIWGVFIGETAGDGAADWVRSLWQPGAVQTWTSSLVPNSGSIIAVTFVSTRAYLTARCLPRHEGLAYVCNNLLQHSTGDGKLEGYTANGQLQHFHSPQVIDWMRDKVNHPVEGWATLFAHSHPTTKQLLEWLSDGELYQKITTEALNIMIQRDLLPPLEADTWANISDLLHASLQLVMLKKDKRRIEAVLEQLSDLGLC